MDKLLRGFITVERTIQIMSLVGVLLFLGYFGVISLQSDRKPVSPSISPTLQQ